jgi:hypothetical protein
LCRNASRHDVCGALWVSGARGGEKVLSSKEVEFAEQFTAKCNLEIQLMMAGRSGLQRAALLDSISG